MSYSQSSRAVRGCRGPLDLAGAALDLGRLVFWLVSNI